MTKKMMAHSMKLSTAHDIQNKSRHHMHYDFTCTTAQSFHTGLDCSPHQRPAHDSHLPIERVLSNAVASHNLRPAHDSHWHIESVLSNAEACPPMLTLKSACTPTKAYRSENLDLKYSDYPNRKAGKSALSGQLEQCISKKIKSCILDTRYRNSTCMLLQEG